ncbi:RHS repeat domain-containing protein [Treponema pedis]|uniref:RHS repeat domain-containing protein n=1 Tax=Treponema pedis TaxID=409322 RepID=UPI0025B12774|nr:RHS repeat-associated core domain-containing protein [Treponema pedis]
MLNFVFFVMLKNKIEQSAAQSCLRKKLSLSEILTDRAFENRRSRYKELGKKVPQAYRVYVEDTFLPYDAVIARIFSKDDVYGADYGFGLDAPKETEQTNPQDLFSYRRNYMWNERNLLTKSSDKNYTVHYRYGEDRQRALKYTEEGRSETLYFNNFFTIHIPIYDKDNPQGLRVHKHIFVGNSRLVTAMTHTDNSGDNEEQKEKRYYYHSDHLGSAQFVTDWKGRQYEHIEYTPYGELWIEEVAAGIDKLPFRFTGKEMDEETGLYYYGARYLDPKYSRWLSGDPALGEYIPQAPIDDEAKKHNENLPGMGGVFNVVNLHVYHYAGNNPVKYTDPDGRDIILLNRSYGAYKEGHNAVLIGNDKTGGWLYFSKDGKNLTGSINKAEYFPTLESFIEHNKKLDTDEQYDRAYQVKTSAMNDSRMIAEGLDIYDKKYSLDEKRNEITLEVISQNCADLCADIGKKGGVNISKPKHSRFPVGTFTKPNFQYEDFKKNNKGEEIQIK